MIIRSFKGKTPQIGSDCFVAENAAIVGDVVIGNECSIWYGAAIRGDENSIEVGDRVSVQECAVLHVSEGEGGALKIGSDVIIGHNATVHACTVGNHVLIGMGSTVLDGAVVSDGSIVAAGALVLGRTVIGPGELWAGVPAKLVKTIAPEGIERNINRGVATYVELAKEYLKAQDEAL